MPNALLLEICCYTVESVRIAAKAGAQRVELCSDKFTGGGTPTAEMLVEAKKFNIPVNVMVHSREGDYCYEPDAFDALKREMQLMKDLGADGLVFGVLHKNRTVDNERTCELLDLAYPLDVTYHRAMDEMLDPLKALDDLIAIGIPRVLTSGTKRTALEGKDMLTQLVKRADGKISVMAGGSVRTSNIHQLLSTGAHEFHTSALLNNAADASEEEITKMLSQLHSSS
jgi:copper homeostasis protein